VGRRLPAFLVLVLLPACGGGGGDDSEAAKGDPAQGEKLFAEQRCGNCHAFAAAESDGLVGPDLDKVVAKYDAAFVRESLVDPGAFIEKGSRGSIGGDEDYENLMPSYAPDSEIVTKRLTDEQLDDLVAYLFAEAE
jgi:mono/diheme cytochrome c family protein